MRFRNLLLFLFFVSTSIILHSEKTVDPVFFRSNTWKLHNRRGRPLALIHGLGNDGMKVWKPLLPILKKKYSVLSIGLPGLGGTIPPPTVSPLTYAVYCEWLIRRHFGNRRATVICHSYGGAVGLRLTAIFPQRVKHLISINGAGSLHPVSHLLWFGQHYSGIPLFLDSLAVKLFFHTPNSSVREGWKLLQFNLFLRKMLPKGGSRLQALLSLRGYDLRHLLRPDIPPVTFILGRDDNIVPPRSGEYLHYLLPKSRLLYTPQDNHGPMRTNPKLFARTLDKALRGAGALAPERPQKKRSRTNLTIKKTGFRIVTGKNYRTVRISDSINITFRNCSIGRLIIDGSAVNLVNCRTGKIISESAALKLTACTAEGKPPLQLTRTAADLAGCTLKGKHHILKTDGISKLVFSLCRLQTRGRDRIMHNTMQPKKGMWRP